jgi:hypothetical protein
VIGGKDRDERAFDRWRRPALPGGEPFDDLFETAEGARRLGEQPVTGASRRDGLRIGPWERRQQYPDFFEGTDVFSHAAGFTGSSRNWRALASFRNDGVNRRRIVRGLAR